MTARRSRTVIAAVRMENRIRLGADEGDPLLIV